MIYEFIFLNIFSLCQIVTNYSPLVHTSSIKSTSKLLMCDSPQKQISMKLICQPKRSLQSQLNWILHSEHDWSLTFLHSVLKISHINKPLFGDCGCQWGSWKHQLVFTASTIHPKNPLMLLSLRFSLQPCVKWSLWWRWGHAALTSLQLTSAHQTIGCLSRPKEKAMNIAPVCLWSCSFLHVDCFV